MARPSLLGSGLLVRARSTSLGLLGLTAAVGLSMVALGLNQSWPLVAGGPIPKLPGKREPRSDQTNSGGNWQRVEIPPELRPGLLHAAPGARAVNRGSGKSRHEAPAVLEVAVSTPVSEGTGGSPDGRGDATESPLAQDPGVHVQPSPQPAPQAPSSPSNNQPTVSAPAASPQASAAPENAVPPAPAAEENEATDENGASAPSPPSPPGWGQGHGHGHH